MHFTIFKTPCSCEVYCNPHIQMYFHTREHMACTIHVHGFSNCLTICSRHVLIFRLWLLAVIYEILLIRIIFSIINCKTHFITPAAYRVELGCALQIYMVVQARILKRCLKYYILFVLLTIHFRKSIGHITMKHCWRNTTIKYMKISAGGVMHGS